MTEKGLAVFCGQEKVNRTGPRGKAGEWLNFCNFPAEGLERLPDRGAKHRIKRSLCFGGVLFVCLFLLRTKFNSWGVSVNGKETTEDLAPTASYPRFGQTARSRPLKGRASRLDGAS